MIFFRIVFNTLYSYWVGKHLIRHEFEIMQQSVNTSSAQFCSMRKHISPGAHNPLPRTTRMLYLDSLKASLMLGNQRLSMSEKAWTVCLQTFHCKCHSIQAIDPLIISSLPKQLPSELILVSPSWYKLMWTGITSNIELWNTFSWPDISNVSQQPKITFKYSQFWVFDECYLPQQCWPRSTIVIWPWAATN